jgi:AraC-like DNA-binding protein
VEGQIVSLLSGGGALVGLFVAALLVARPGADRRANLVLSALMFTLSLSIIYPLLFEAWPALSTMHAVVVIEPFQFLMTPLMGLYVRLLLVPDYRPRPVQLLHLLPFALIGVFSLKRIPPGFEGQAHGLAPTATEILWALLVIQAFLYLLPATRLLFRYRHSLRDEESNLAGIDLSWLWWFVHSFLTLTTIYAVLLVVVMHGPKELPVRPYLSIALTVVVFVVGQRALMQRKPPVIEGLEKKASAPAASAPRVVVTPEEAAEIKIRLVRAMEADRLYLDSELSLSDLVTRIGATRNQVSYVINTHLGKNFYDFVNEYRVREVVRQMNEKAAEDLKITAIAFDAGFNSKPAFNLVFKKHTGLTPSEYRDRNRRARKLSAASP